MYGRAAAADATAGGLDSPSRVEALRAVGGSAVRYLRGATAAVPPSHTLCPYPAQAILSLSPSPCPAQGSALLPMHSRRWGGGPRAEAGSAWAGSSDS